MRVGIIGAGAIGLLLASTLSGPTMNIHLITRTKEQAENIHKHGIERDEGNHVHVSQTESFIEAVEGPAPQWDWALLTLKQPHLTDELLASLNHFIATDTRVVCFQNGLGHLDKVNSHLAPRLIYAAVTTEGALKEGMNQVRWTGHGHTWLGRAFEESIPREADQEEQAFLDLARQAGISVDLSNQIVKKMWHKLLINSVINPLTALFSIRNGELLNNPHILQLMRTMFHEALRVAKKEGIQADGLWEQVLTVCKRTAQNKSSMYMDLLHKRVTEVEWINGFLIKKAAEHQLLVETHQAVYDLITEIEAGGTFCRA